MQNVILSSIAIPDLVTALADEMESRILRRQQDTTPPASEQKRLYGDKAAAAYLGCQPLTIGKLRASGAIPYYRYSRRYYYIASELDQALKGGGNRFGELRGNRKVAK